MREIRFRAWKRVNTPEMFNNVQAIDFKSGIAHLGYSLSSFTERTDKERLDNLILMQYVGLKDKNGTEIYEGDIVQTGWQGNKKGVVVFESSTYCVDSGDGYMYFNHPESYEVIGNIYQHPEILGDSQ